MDYIFWSSLVASGLLHVLISYDIACQWTKNLYSRMANIPSPLHKPENMTLRACLPVWHGRAHNLKCEAEHTISYVQGAAATDGEEPERQWAVYNKSSASTKEMGEVSRANFLEDKMDYQSYVKNVNLGMLCPIFHIAYSLEPEYSLPKKLDIAYREQLVQDVNFKAMEGTVDPISRTSWLEHLRDWKSGARPDNPYLLDKSGVYILV